MTMAAIANITKFTEPKDYELIVVDCVPNLRFPLRDDYKVLKIDKKIEVGPLDIGYYAAMNLGAKKARGEFLCFIENDIFVHEGWLDGLKRYLDGSFDVDMIMPSQLPTTRNWVLQSYRVSEKEALLEGKPEQGLMLLRNETFVDIGGWNGDFGFGWKSLYEKLGKNRVRIGSTSKVIVTHITGVTYYHQMENEPKKHVLNSVRESKL
jgi:glycosyltransferase involved in cell wall biosynthesis